MKAQTAITAAALVLEVVSCARGSISWNDPAPLPPRLTAASEIGFDVNGKLVPRTQPPVSLPVFTEQCTATVRVSGDSASGYFAVWWAVRADSTADLVLSHATDGLNWSPATRVDSTDRAATGCERTPPSIFVDGQDVHIAYAMTASEGAGIFTAHSMDGGATFHTPVTVAYGEHPGRTAIAARRDLVAVAYEDPNANPARISLALSRTGGHLFEPSIVASPPSGDAYSPGVALGDGLIAVTWSPDSTSSASAQRLVRTGTVR